MRFTEQDIEGVLSMASRYLRANKVGVSGMENTRDGMRFMIDENGNLLANVAGRGNIAITEIVADKSISKDTSILTDSGNLDWGFITDEMIANAPAAMQLESLPIRLHKGNTGYGLVHIAKHLSSFTNQDLVKLLENVFNKPNKIYAREDNGAIKLEVFPKPPSHWGILELRKIDGYYSIVSFFPRDSKHSKAKGVLIWEYSSQSASSQATSELPKNDLAGNMSQTNQAKLATKSPNNISRSDENTNKIQFSVDAENLVPVAALDGSASRSREIIDFIDRAVDGETDVDLYGEKLSDVFEDWDSTDPASRREWLENYYEEEIRSAQADERLESDLAQKDAYRDAFDTIEEKISAALDEYDLTIDRSNINASGDSFYISFEDAEGESYTLRFSNHHQPARGSYRTSNARETSGIGGSRSVADVSVVLDNGAFDLTPAMEFIRKVAGVSDLSDGADGCDLRFLLSEYSADQTADIVAAGQIISSIKLLKNYFY